MTRYEIVLMDTGKYITTHLQARSVDHLAQQILALYPGATVTSAKELA